MAKSKIRKDLQILLEINRDFFLYALVTYLILLLIDTAWRKSVSYRINLDILFITVIISGIITVIFQGKTRDKRKGDKITQKKIMSYYQSLSWPEC